MGSKSFKERRLILLLSFVIILYPIVSNGQDCPSFEITKIINTSDGAENGSVQIKIESSKIFDQENFEIRQKEKQVTGPLGYDVEILISNSKLIINGLRKSQDMYLSEYIIRFSDNTCNNGELLEVGIFKIR